MGNPYYETKRPWHGLDDAWMTVGLCSNLEPEERARYFWDINADVRSKIIVERLKLRCHDCPVEGRCLAYALQADMHGVWGGTTRRERTRMPVKRRRALIALAVA